jgi:hypothetical protein
MQDSSAIAYESNAIRSCAIVRRVTIWMSNSFMNLRMRPGDTIFIPEKIIGGSQVWQNILGMAQIMSSATLPLAIGGVL